MDVQLSLRIVRRWIVVILATGVVAAVAAYAASSFLPRTYESRATLLVGQGLESARLDYTQILAAQLQAQTYAAIATGRSALASAIEALGLETTPEQLARQTSTEVASGSRFVEIIALDTDAYRAADIANAIADYMIALTAGNTSDEVLATIQQELTATGEEVATAEAELALIAEQSPSATGADRANVLTERILTLRSIRAQLLAQASEGSTNPITIVSEAAPSDEPSGPHPALNAVLAAAVGILVAIVLVLVVDREAPAEIRPSAFGAVASRSEGE